MSARCLAGLWAALLSLACTCTGALAQPRFVFDNIPTSLPKSVVPTRTDLVLTLDPASPRFSGDATIHISVRHSVSAIVLHARDLELDQASLRRGRTARSLRLAEASIQAQTWSLQPTDGRPIPAGRYALRLRYAGRVNSAGDGLFRVVYKGATGEQSMLTTQFEAIHARRVLPTFDAPLFRQVFQLDVLAPNDSGVFSNTPEIARHAEGPLVRHRFAPTPPMASYLLAVAVGPLESIADSVDGVALRVVAPIGRAKNGRFALDVTKQLLPFYRQYFGQRYPLPKLDQVAVPGVRIGAQEDWGLISYLETVLLLEPERDTQEARYRIFSLMAHEIAHQWFGNLVSAASWDDIWLNEAFASWMQFKATHHFHPEWDAPLRRRMSLEQTLASDATAATRPIRGGLVSEERISDVFDGITYQKGAAVVGMLEQWVGAEAFRRGLAAYMAARAFRPATADDLWYHLAKASGQPVERVSRFWTENKGFPSVAVSQSCDSGQTRLRLQQSRFALSGGQPAAVWPVPLRVAHGDKIQDLLMEGAEQGVTWPGCDERPVVVNSGGAGYYRVLPDAALAARLLERFPALQAADQLAMLSDSFAFVMAGARDLPSHIRLLSATRRVQGEGRETIMLMALRQWQELGFVFRGADAEPLLKAAERKFLAPELARLGWEPRAGESAAAALLRATVIQELAVLQDPAALAGARERCPAARANDATKVPASIRGAVLAACAVSMEPGQFDQLFAQFRSAPSLAEQRLLLRALGTEADEVRARKLLSAAVAGEFPGATAATLAYVLADSTRLGSAAYRLAVEFWEPLGNAAGESAVGGKQLILPYVSKVLTDPGDADVLVADQLKLVGETGRMFAERAASVIRARAALRDRELAGLTGALQSSLD